MSKLVAFAAIQGGYNVVSQVEGEYQRALEQLQEALQVVLRRTNLSSSIALRNERAWLHLGFAREYLKPASKHHDPVKALEHLQIDQVAYSSQLPNRITSQNGRRWTDDNGEEHYVSLYTLLIEPEIMNIYDIQMKEGRSFSENFNNNNGKYIKSRYNSRPSR